MTDEITVPLPDGVLLRAEARGPRDAPVCVVLLHGWTLDRRIWHRQVEALPARSGVPVQVISYDARGHGRSTPTRRHSATLAQLGDDLAAVLAAVADDRPVILAGHSLGGMTIMEYAHLHPDDFARRVAGMVLVATTARGATHTSYGLPTPLARLVRMAELTGAGMLARAGAWHPHRAVLPALRPGLRWLLFGEPARPEDLHLTTSSVARASLRSIGGFRPSIDTQQRLETLATMPPVPAVVLVGDRDRLTPPACAREIVAELPTAELVVCPRAGHMLTLERPAEVTAALASMVRSATAVDR